MKKNSQFAWKIANIENIAENSHLYFDDLLLSTVAI